MSQRESGRESCKVLESRGNVPMCRGSFLCVKGMRCGILGKGGKMILGVGRFFNEKRTKEGRRNGEWNDGEVKGRTKKITNSNILKSYEKEE